MNRPILSVDGLLGNNKINPASNNLMERLANTGAGEYADSIDKMVKMQ